MRNITYALIASVALAAVLAGCTSNPNQSTDNTSQVDGNVTVTCPSDTNSTADSNATENSTMTTTCGSDTTTNSTNSTSGGV